MKRIFTLYCMMSFRHCLQITFIILLSISSKSSNAYVIQGGHFWSNPDLITKAGSLPVVLTPLKGYYSNGVSYLSWTSLQESNSGYFDIQRSKDGVNFYNIGKVIAKGSSDTEVDYKYADVKADAGVNYYRLKLSDKDGRFQFSNIFMVNVTITGINVTAVHPGPFTDKVKITISSDLRIPAVIKLFDYSGKILSSQETILNRGITEFTIKNLDNLARGFYIVKVQAGEMIITKTILK